MAAGYLLGQTAGAETLFVSYDLKANPLSYDITWNFCLAEFVRLRLRMQHQKVD